MRWSERGWALVAALALSFHVPARGDAPQDELAAAIQDAVARGREHLLPLIGPLVAQQGDYPMGRIALPLAALLRAGVSPSDPQVERGFEEITKLEPRETYSVACALMALDALSQARLREGRDGRTRGVAKGVISDSWIRERMQALVHWLVQSRNVGEGTWSYPHGRQRSRDVYDNSNTQFAVLGLEIAVQHHLSVPREVFSEIAQHFTRTILREKKAVEVRIEFELGKQVYLTKARPAPKILKIPSGGWDYVEKGRTAYSSMTAAGVSSLLVARDGLGGKLPEAAESALDAGLAWIATGLDQFLHRPAHPLYTLYSLEKVGDLGNIVTFNGRDWYEEGARVLLKSQGRDGGWGATHDTAFALLFLTRATRPAARAHAAPRVVTRGGGEEQPGRDLVYLDTIDGYVSAAEFFTFLAGSRDPELIPVAELVVKNFPLARQGELVPHLLKFWGKGRDPYDAFARKALKAVTGEEYREAAGYQKWSQAFENLRALERGATVEPGKISLLFAEMPGLRLRARLVEWIRSHEIAESIPVLIDELRETDPEYHRRIGEILERFLGERPPDAPQGADSVAAPGAREEIDAWKALWIAKGDEAIVSLRVRRLISEIEALAVAKAKGGAAVAGEGAAKDGARRKEGERLAGLLAAEGKKAVPRILKAMEAGETEEGCSVWLVVALERISEKKLGFSPVVWREWWEGNK